MTYITEHAIRSRIEAFLSTVAVCVADARKANSDGLPCLTMIDLRSVNYFVEQAIKLADELAERKLAYHEGRTPPAAKEDA